MLTWFLTTRLGRWIAAIGTISLAILTAWLGGRLTGKHRQKEDDAAAQDKANAEAQQQKTDAIEERHVIDSKVDELPNAPPQELGKADPTGAAGQLDGWLRDKDGGKD